MSLTTTAWALSPVPAKVTTFPATLADPAATVDDLLGLVDERCEGCAYLGGELKRFKLHAEDKWTSITKEHTELKDEVKGLRTEVLRLLSLHEAVAIREVRTPP